MATILLPESRHLNLGDKWLRVMGFVRACRRPNSSFQEAYGGFGIGARVNLLGWIVSP